MLNKFPFYFQHDSKDCGPTCLKIIAKFYGKIIDIRHLRDLAETTRIGSNLLMMSHAAEKIGFRTLGAQLTIDQLEEIPLPCILHWNQNHYVVLYDVKYDKTFFHKKKNSDNLKFYISDPSHGHLVYDYSEFKKFWLGSVNADEDKQGIALLLEPTPEFYELEDGKESKFSFSKLWHYVKPYKAFVYQLIIGLAVGNILQMIFPFLTQSIVDVGINDHDIGFIYLILIAQLFLFFGKISLDVIRNYILLNLSSRINISLISNFFKKLMALPISFFDVKMTGDIMQRISDHQRIERFLTTSSLTTIFSIINMLFMGAILAYYNLKIFIVFFCGSIMYFLWVLFFLKKREEIDYKRFSESAKEQSKIMEIINGMQEIKLHNAENISRWSWEKIQVKLFKISINSLILEQYQSIGSSFINELKNILIIFMSASLVIQGDITLGTMLAISTIVGGLNGPVLQIIDFVREFQDAKIAMTRLSEIHEKITEDEIDSDSIHDFNFEKNIDINTISFRYPGNLNDTLSDLSVTIPAKKITAIVGSSGSGKTTLMKLLLKFYPVNTGYIKVDSIDINSINSKKWRELVGTVMQEGYIFNDTIANNIALGEEKICKKSLEYAIHVANLKSYIEDLPKGINTLIGQEGVGMSVGQKQRILIARAVYKDPQILFFDEATSALDANNEREIMEKLNFFFNDKTVIIIAHRLSTVMNADQIIVLDKGHIVEIGNHQKLIEKKGYYFELIKKQLNLGE